MKVHVLLKMKCNKNKSYCNSIALKTVGEPGCMQGQMHKSQKLVFM